MEISLSLFLLLIWSFKHTHRELVSICIVICITGYNDSFFWRCRYPYNQTTGTCFIKKIYASSSSLLQGKYLPFSPSPLRLNIFRLFVILSLTQLYRYTPEIFLFSTATFKYTYWAPSDELDMNIQRTSLGLLFSHFRSGLNWFRK